MILKIPPSMPRKAPHTQQERAIVFAREQAPQTWRDTRSRAPPRPPPTSTSLTSSPQRPESHTSTCPASPAAGWPRLEHTGVWLWACARIPPASVVDSPHLSRFLSAFHRDIAAAAVTQRPRESEMSPLTYRAARPTPACPLLSNFTPRK